MKEEALLIASRLDTVRVLNHSKAQESVLRQAQDWIRRLVEENDRIIRDLIGASLYEHDYKTLIEKLKPLSDDEIGDMYCKYSDRDEWFKFARAIEERHGIK